MFHASFPYESLSRPKALLFCVLLTQKYKCSVKTFILWRRTKRLLNIYNLFIVSGQVDRSASVELSHSFHLLLIVMRNLYCLSVSYERNFKKITQQSLHYRIRKITFAAA